MTVANEMKARVVDALRGAARIGAEARATVARTMAASGLGGGAAAGGLGGGAAADGLEGGAGRAHAQGTPRASRRAFYFGLVIVVLSLLSGLATGLILTGLTPIVPTNEVVRTTLLINLVLILAMVGVIAWQLTGLWRARRRQAAGSRLHAKVVGLFSIIAVLPAIILAIFASITLDRGLDQWFSSNTKTIVANSQKVAEAYLQEHGQVLRTDAEAMARDLDEAASLDELKALRLSLQAGLRDIPFAYLIDESGKVIASAAQSRSYPYVPPPRSALEEAKSGQIVYIGPGRHNRVGAIKRLRTFPGLYLYVARPVSNIVIGHLRRTQAAVTRYSELERRRSGVQVAFGVMYVMIAITMLLAAVWIGLWFAGGLVAPIRSLIAAAQKVSEGDLEAAVPIDRGTGDLVQLSTTFNHMTQELRSQRNELIATNEQLNERRRFIEAVLSGVSAGVLGLDVEGTITIANPSSEKLLGRSRRELVGRPLTAAVPEFEPLYRELSEKRQKPHLQGQVTLTAGGMERNLAVQITREGGGEFDDGYVVTFDDITELVTAQRSAAWADIARRIAHEIKNPLTPIQLSAERLRRKYGKVVGEDREVFDRCTETIIRQVGDIGRMVDEFSSFARMPDPEMEEHDLREIVREVAFLFQSSHSEIEIGTRLPDGPLVVKCDRRLVNQALTNLVKNAIEAIEGFKDGGKVPPGYRGHVEIAAARKEENAEIRVVDNGCGLPRKNRRRLVEPYMTTRAKGTGIGLAVVHKVAEQHGGILRLEDAPKGFDPHQRGAAIHLVLPIAPNLRGRAGAGDRREANGAAREGARGGDLVRYPTRESDRAHSDNESRKQAGSSRITSNNLE